MKNKEGVSSKISKNVDIHPSLKALEAELVNFGAQSSENDREEGLSIHTASRKRKVTTKPSKKRAEFRGDKYRKSTPK
jgi:hypothetical protein